MARYLPLVLGMLCVAACSKSESSSPTPTTDSGTAADTSDDVADAAQEALPDVAPDASELEVTIYAHTDLPRTTDTQGLSATAFDPTTRTLYSLQDTTPAIVPLVANDDYTVFVPGDAIALTNRPDATWDGEGLVLTGSGFIAVTVETTPLVEQFTLVGAYDSTVSIPAIYEDQRAGNKGNESLTISPSGQYLFTVNEQALLSDGDGPTKTTGSLVRIAKLGASSLQGPQYAWLTEPLGPGTGGDMGVSELAALDDDTLLVLERGWQSDYGNTVRIFRTSLSGGTDVSAEASLGPTTPTLAKELIVDLATLPPAGFDHPSTQPNPILDNYEALSIGPTLADGRRLLFVTTDDNASDGQVARVLVLAVQGL